MVSSSSLNDTGAVTTRNLTDSQQVNCLCRAGRRDSDSLGDTVGISLGCGVRWARRQVAIQADDTAHRVAGGFELVGVVNDSV